MAKRHKITFVESREAPNDMGEIVEVWNPIYPSDIEKSSSWVSIKDLKGSAFYAAQQTNTKIEGTMLGRWRNDIKPEYQIQYNGRQFEIISAVNVDEKNKDLLIRYKEVI